MYVENLRDRESWEDLNSGLRGKNCFSIIVNLWMNVMRHFEGLSSQQGLQLVKSLP